MRSPVPVRQRFRPGIDEIPDDVLEQIAHAGDCAGDLVDDVTISDADPGDMEGLTMARAAVCNLPHFSESADCPLTASEWRTWSGAARWAARLLGVEVRRG